MGFNMKKLCGILLLCVVLVIFKDDAHAYSVQEETQEENNFSLDYDSIDYTLNDMMPKKSKFSFRELVNELMKGNIKNVLFEIAIFVRDTLLNEIELNWTSLFQMVGIAVIGAIFASISSSFSGQHVAETGFYVTYMVLFSLLMISFVSMTSIAQTVVSNLIDLMRTIVPVYGTVITYSVGISTGSAWYQFLMILIVAADWIMAKVILNLIKIYVVLFIVNQISKEDYFSKMCDLIHTIIDWSLKSILGATLGLNIIQRIILPAFDSVKNGWISKLISAIPGIGSTFSSAAKAMVASGVLLKNSVGIGLVIVLCIVCIWPLLQLLVVTLMYKLLGALLQPVTENRLLDCIRAVEDGTLMLLKSSGTVLILFIISLAVITGTGAGVPV